MQYYIIAGEASGDLHGANLIREIKKIDQQANFRGWGGDKMKAEGVTLVKHYKDHALMGFIEVLANIKTIKQNLNYCKKDINEQQPDMVIFIDYPGFNLRVAKHVKQLGIKTVYYISPKVWAWKKWRVKSIKKHIDKMFVILPFEKKFYKKYAYEVKYLGNPLIDIVDQKKNDIPGKASFLITNNLDKRPLIALLAGSRKQEIQRCLPQMLKAVKPFQEYQVVIAGMSVIDEQFYKKYTGDADAKLIFDQTYELINHAEAAIVTSGTAVLETAIFDVPEIACYKTSVFTGLIALALVHIKYFTLVNLIMEREVVKELLQYNIAGNARKELKKILYDRAYRQKMLKDFAILREKLGVPGVTKKIAAQMVDFGNNNKKQ